MPKNTHLQPEHTSSFNYAAHPVELNRVGDWSPHEWFDSERLKKASPYLQASADFTATVNDMVQGLTVCMEMLEADDTAQETNAQPVFTVSQRGAIMRMCASAIPHLGDQAEAMLLHTSKELSSHEVAHE